MSPFPWYHVAILAGLILLNGVFSMSELAIVSARTARLRMAAERGSRGPRRRSRWRGSGQVPLDGADRHHAHRHHRGAYSGTTLGGPVGERLAALGLDSENAADAGFALVIALTTYFSSSSASWCPSSSLARGPADRHCHVAAMAWLAKLAAPFVWLLDTSSNLLMRFLRMGHRATIA